MQIPSDTEVPSITFRPVVPTRNGIPLIGLSNLEEMVLEAIVMFPILNKRLVTGRELQSLFPTMSLPGLRKLEKKGGTVISREGFLSVSPIIKFEICFQTPVTKKTTPVNACAV